MSQEAHQAVPAAPAARAESKYWMLVVFLFFLGWIFMYADRTILNPVMANIKEEYGLDNAQLGLISSVFFLAYALMQVPAGVMGDKIGRKLVLVPGFLIFAAATALSGLAKTFPMFMGARVLTGLGQGTYYGPQYALSSETVPLRYRSLGAAIINSGMAFGMALGLIGASYITLEWGMSWRMPFYIYAIPTAIIGLAIWIFVKENPPQKYGEKAAETTANAQAAAPKASVGSLFKNRNLVLTFVMVFCSLYGFFMVLTWLPYYLQTERGITGSQVGNISALTAWASIPGAILFSSVSDKMGRRKPLVFILVPIAAISIWAMASIQDINLLIAFLIIYGFFGKLALDPVLVAFVADSAPRESYSTVFGVYNFVGMSSSIIAPYLTGYLADKTGSLSSGFYVAAVLLLVGMVFMIFCKEKPGRAVTA